jgi:hypothetical protein
MDTREKPGLIKRSSVVNGIFYPESPETLVDIFASWGLRSGFASGGQVILAPHGAWNLTGNIAASAFAAVQKQGRQTGKRINRVLLLGSCHDSSEEGIFLSESAFFEPPQGELQVDQKFNRRLASCSTLIRINDIPHLCEHSLEVLLPLVKHCFPDAKIVPILMSGRRPLLISCLAKALRVILEKYMEESLIVVSSTVSRNSDPVIALSMADEFRSLLEAMDTKAYLSSLAVSRISACGAAVLGALFESGLLDGKHFSSLGPLVQSMGENGETVYHGAFAA